MKPELIWALKVCETCLGTKGCLSAWEQAKGISFSGHRLPCVFLIDRPRPHLIEMTCSWQGARAVQVDHLSAGELSSICFIKKFDGGLRHNRAAVGFRCRLHLCGKRLISPCGVNFPKSPLMGSVGLLLLLETYHVKASYVWSVGGFSDK